MHFLGLQFRHAKVYSRKRNTDRYDFGSGAVSVSPGRDKGYVTRPSLLVTKSGRDGGLQGGLYTMDSRGAKFVSITNQHRVKIHIRATEN